MEDEKSNGIRFKTSWNMMQNQSKMMRASWSDPKPIEGNQNELEYDNANPTEDDKHSAEM